MKIAIIGCGITGMSAGIALQKAGIDTVIFEQANKPGGVITVLQYLVLWSFYMHGFAVMICTASL